MGKKAYRAPLPILRRHGILSSLALWAALAQLWLGTLHANMGTAAFCGDGSTGRSAALQQQLPPELRLPLERLDRAAQPECEQCALGSGGALPPSTAATMRADRAAVVQSVAASPVQVSAHEILLPPSRGPPATR
ncbi:MAG: hypothetical protein WC809_20970 [Sinimarinibacterium sp.]